MTDETQKLVTLGIAFAGLLLGVLNSWWLWKRDRIRLRLHSTFEREGEELGDPMAVFSLNVHNLSSFPVTITDAGVQFAAPTGPHVNFGQTLQRDGDISTVDLPIRLESRDSITLTGSAAESDVTSAQVKRLFVRTACGVTRTCKPMTGAVRH